MARLKRYALGDWWVIAGCVICGVIACTRIATAIFAATH